MEAIMFHDLLQELPSIIIFTKSHLRDGDSAEKIKSYKKSSLTRNICINKGQFNLLLYLPL